MFTIIIMLNKKKIKKTLQSNQPQMIKQVNILSIQHVIIGKGALESNQHRGPSCM